MKVAGLMALAWVHYFIACYSYMAGMPWWANPGFVVNLVIGFRRQWQCAKRLGWL